MNSRPKTTLRAWLAAGATALGLVLMGGCGIVGLYFLFLFGDNGIRDRNWVFPLFWFALLWFALSVLVAWLVQIRRRTIALHGPGKQRPESHREL